MALARIGIGSNLGDARATVLAACVRLGRLGRVRARSALYGSKAWGVTDQPDFINAALILETDLSPELLLRALKALETELGRVESYRWGPRAIDLDILAYDEIVRATPDLTLPHPRLAERAFALEPLAEIDPTFRPLLERLDPQARREVWRLPRA